MTREVLFLHGAGPDAHAEDAALAAQVQERLNPDDQFHFPRIMGLENYDWAEARDPVADAIAALPAGATVVAHSAGGVALLKILTEQPDIAQLDAVHLVAVPYVVAEGAFRDEPGALPLNFGDLLPRIGRIRLYHSRDDAEITFDDLQCYADALPEAEVVPVDGFGHQFAPKECAALLDAL